MKWACAGRFSRKHLLPTGGEAVRRHRTTGTGSGEWDGHSVLGTRGDPEAIGCRRPATLAATTFKALKLVRPIVLTGSLAEAYDRLNVSRSGASRHLALLDAEIRLAQFQSREAAAGARRGRRKLLWAPHAHTCRAGRDPASGVRHPEPIVSLAIGDVKVRLRLGRLVASAEIARQDTAQPVEIPDRDEAVLTGGLANPRPYLRGRFAEGDPKCAVGLSGLRPMCRDCSSNGESGDRNRVLEIVCSHSTNWKRSRPRIFSRRLEFITRPFRESGWSAARCP